MKTTWHAFRLLVGLTLLTGAVYPLAVWVAGQLLFPHAAEGSLLRRQGVVVGSELLAQKGGDPRYFTPRPSAGGYATVPSGASNLAWTSARLRETTTAAATAFRVQNHLDAGTSLPADVVTASGSGLDPDLSPAGVRLQVPRVAAARGLSPAQRDTLYGLVARLGTGGQIGPERINILRLNLALDEAFPPQ